MTNQSSPPVDVGSNDGLGPVAEARAFHNPWRVPLENCMTGDNFLRSQEWVDLIEELDDLYRYRCGQHESLNVAYANGRDDQREEDDELVRWAYGKLHRQEYSKLEDALMLDRMKLRLEHGA